MLLERHVEGRELAVSLINGIALPAVEARPREEDRFTYEARYEIGRTEYVCPADLGAAEGPILDAAMRTWDVLGFDGFGRVDMILGGGRSRRCWRRTRSPASPTPPCCRWPPRRPGLGFERLCDRLLDLALERAGVGEPLGN